MGHKMLFQSMSVENYKSLKRVSISLKEGLTLLVGANAAGKSNIADCFVFLADVYRHGLDITLEEEGGLGSILTREGDQVADTLKIAVCVALPEEKISLEHRFTLEGRSRVLDGHKVVAESLIIRFLSNAKNQWSGTEVLSLQRTAEGQIDTSFYRDISNFLRADSTPESVDSMHMFHQFVAGLKFLQLPENLPPVPDDRLALLSLSSFVPLFDRYVKGVSSLRVYQPEPSSIREEGQKSPRPEMAYLGWNLPAVIQHFRSENLELWGEVENAMRQIMPSLEIIQIDDQGSGTLVIQVKEHGVQRPWRMAELSDGTTRALALLTAIFDPRSSVLILEEIENSLHPWMIRRVLDACKTASKRKQIVITTHSPVVMNGCSADDILVVWKGEQGTSVAPMLTLEPDLQELWQSGEIDAFSIFDSGVLPQSLPPVE